MKIVVTGSLGHISKPLAQQLVQNGHSITIVSSKADKQAEIEALSATAAIGSVEDVNFLTETFKDADAVYTMIPPPNYFDQTLDLTSYTHRIGNNFKTAIENSGVKRVVHLSSIGADLDSGTGVIVAYHDVEVMLDQLTGVDITFMRPASFYYNLLGYVDMIKHAGAIMANYGANDIIPWVAPEDIANAIATELEAQPVHRKVIYVGSDEVTGSETARIIGEAIGKPDLQWILISDEETKNGLIGIGMQPAIAGELVEMYAALHNGTFAADYHRNKPASPGKVKLKDFAKEFAMVYHQKR